MPRFFFDFRQNNTLEKDAIGCEHASAEEAYLEAFRAAREMWSELLARRRDPRRCYFEIRDADDNSLFILPFAEVLESCHDFSEARPALLETFQHSVGTMARLRRAHRDFLDELQKSRNVLEEAKALIAVPL